MKNLKKIIFAVLMVLVAGAVINVNAARVPYAWLVGGERVNVDSPNQAGTATLEKDGQTVTLHLNNYSGGKLVEECYGTGQTGMTFIIDLKGENTITSDDVGIDFIYYNSSNTKIQFKGDGTLKINAPKPISYENYENTMIIKPASNVYTDKEETVKEEVKEESKEEVEQVTTIGATNDNNNLVLYICFGAYAVLTLVIIIILTIALTKKNKKEVM